MKHIQEQDPELYAAMTGELNRERENLELIASENFTSMAVLEAQGSVLTNKYAEGYPYRWSKRPGKSIITFMVVIMEVVNILMK